MELEHSLRVFDSADPVPPGIASMFNALLRVSKEVRPMDPVVRSIDRIHADLVEQYTENGPAVRDCGTTRAQLVQMQAAVEDPEEYEPPDFEQMVIKIPSLKALRVDIEKRRAVTEGDNGEEKDDKEPDERDDS